MNDGDAKNGLRLGVYVCGGENTTGRSLAWDKDQQVEYVEAGHTKKIFPPTSVYPPKHTSVGQL